MRDTNEIKALFQLLDDPDEEVFGSVSKRIISLGTDIIPRLEEFWLNAENEIIQHRIETLISRVSLRDIKSKFVEWDATAKNSLFEAMSLLCKYAHPEIKENKLEKTLKNIHRSCWLELNNYLTPLEEVHIVNSIIFSMYKFSSERNSLKDPDTYYLCDVFENKKGNQYSLAMLYLMVTQMLDIPVFVMKISNFVVLGYVNNLYNFGVDEDDAKAKTQFFIEPTEGTILSRQDVDSFIKKYEVEVDENSFKPLKNEEFVQYFTNALSQAYRNEGLIDKADDISSIFDDRTPNQED